MQQQKLREKLAAEAEVETAEARGGEIDESEDEMVEAIEDDEETPMTDSLVADASDTPELKDKTDEYARQEVIH